MKYIFLCLLICLIGLSENSHAQSLAVNTDGSTADASSILDVKSTAKGMLAPRMNKTQRNAIVSPATGLLVFQDAPDSTGFYYYDGGKWNYLLSGNDKGWDIIGNSGTSAATHFLGTTDNVPLVIKTDNTEKVRIMADGKFGIGTNNPSTLLANNSGNTAASDGFGLNAPSFNWAMNIGGYVGAFFNSNPNPSRGLMVKIAGNLPASRILDLSVGSTQSGVGTPVMVVNGDGKVGIGLVNPSTQFANNSGNTVASDNIGINNQSFNWSMNNGGYVGSFFNAGTGTNNNGLSVKVGGTATTLLDLSVNATQNAAGTPVMKVGGNGVVGIGTNTANSTYGFAKVEIASEGYLVPSDLLIRNAVNNAGYAPGLVFQHARGTLASPAAVSNGDYLQTITGMNYDGSNYTLSNAIDFWADGNVSAGIVPTRMQFATQDAAGGWAYRLTIKNDGKIGIGTATPNTLLANNNGNTAAADGVGLNTQSLNWSMNNGGYVAGFYNAGTGGSNSGVSIKVGGTASTILDLSVGATQNAPGTSVMMVRSDGFVGIGTNAPSSQLHLSTNSAEKPVSSTWSISSDERLKTIEGNYTKGLAAILKLNTIIYHYKPGNARKLPSDETGYGFSAQEMQKVFPEAVRTGKDGYLSIDMHPVLVSYINAFKEQQAQIKGLEDENAQLKNDIRAIKAKLGL